jgi:hypothetical protein
MKFFVLKTLRIRVALFTQIGKALTSKKGQPLLQLAFWVASGGGGN